MLRTISFLLGFWVTVANSATKDHIASLSLINDAFAPDRNVADPNYSQLRSFDFKITTELVPFNLNERNFHSARRGLSEESRAPEYIRIAKISNYNVSSIGSLMGPPIHVRSGDFLKVNVINTLQTAGLSLHWHGFEMINAIEYDGAVGITQCPIEPDGGTFRYAFTVKESPGTYWYHTDSGGIPEAHNAIRGPLIVHPRNEVSTSLVGALNAIFYSDDEHSPTNNGGKESDKFSPLSYRNERILFFSDGFHMHENDALWYIKGGLNPPASKNEDGFTIGTHPWDFGTCNGKLNERIYVTAGETYKLRLINGGSVFALRIRIDSFNMIVLAADSSPVEPKVVDDVILHTAERFDVEITIPKDTPEGSVFLIHANTLEAPSQGYQNKIQASLHVNQAGESGGHRSVTSSVSDNTTPEIVSRGNLEESPRVTINCYSKHEMTFGTGLCLPITNLTSTGVALFQINENTPSLEKKIELHTVDFRFRGPPQFSHFVQIDGGLNYQHVDPMRSMLLPDFDLETDMHPHSASLHLEAHSTSIVIWRTETSMDHPIHLHGYKVEVLEVALPERQVDCTLVKCKLNEALLTHEKLVRLEAMPRGSVVKDTFIVPAGGAVATRLITREPALWSAHSNINLHREDGMALIVNVGNYVAPTDGTWLPRDYPDCDSPHMKSRHEFPACTCYDDKDSVLDTRLTEDYRCSRSHLCRHELSQVANLTHKYPGDIRTHRKFRFLGWSISFMVVISIILLTGMIFYIHRKWGTRALRFETGVDDGRRNSSYFDAVPAMSENEGENEIENEIVTSNSSIEVQLKALFCSEWVAYRPESINLLRVLEVTGLAILTGVIFYNVGEDKTNHGLRESISLLFFSLTLWTFTRMYPAVESYNTWRSRALNIIESRHYSVIACCLARTLVTLATEAWWPFIYCSVCFPLAQVAGGGIEPFLKISAMLSLNTLCYTSIGGLLGTIFDSIPMGMITSTIIAQTSLICAGFYNTLPWALSVIRFISPVYHTFSGVVKTSYRWSDTFECLVGDSDVGVNKCFLERSSNIEDLKMSGINVATFNDPRSDVIWPQIIFLIVYYVVIQFLIFVVVRVYDRRHMKEIELRAYESAPRHEIELESDDDDLDDEIKNLDNAMNDIKNEMKVVKIINDNDGNNKMAVRKSVIRKIT